MTEAVPARTLLPSFQRGGWYRSRDSLALDDGTALCLTPELDVVAELMHAPQSSQGWDPHNRALILCHAAALFMDSNLEIGEVCQTPQQFADKLLAAQGIPAVLTQQWAGQLRSIAAQLTETQPVDCLSNQFISLPANTFLCLEAVYRGLWAGRRVFLRPSQREPWSALRLVAALVAAGVPRQLLTLVNVLHNGVPRLIRFFDEVVLFGGQSVAGLERDLPPHVTIKGPGCSVAIVSAQWTQASVDAVAQLVGRSGGRLCTNVRWVLVERRQAEFARALAQAVCPEALAATRGWAGCKVHDPVQTGAAFNQLFRGLGSADTVLTPAPAGTWQRGQTLPAVVALIAQPVDHPLLRAEPLFPLALVTHGAVPDLGNTFAHSAFAYQVDPAGRVTGLRFDGVDGLRECAA